MRTLTTLSTLAGALLLTLTLTACDSNGDNGNGGGGGLGGDLSWRAQGQSGLTISLSRVQYTDTGLSSSTLGTFTLSGGEASGDLEDGSFAGYELRATPASGDRTASLTLQLRSDGEVIGETSDPEPNQPTWVVEVGETLDLSQ
jgi:hypothetical protein